MERQWNADGTLQERIRVDFSVRLLLSGTVQQMVKLIAQGKDTIVMDGNNNNDVKLDCRYRYQINIANSVHCL